MELGINGKRAIVAGGSAGMGKASAIALAREGVELFIMARGQERLLAVAKEIAAQTGAIVTTVVGDLSTIEGRDALLKACPEPDILVISNSPPKFISGYEAVSQDDWETSFQEAFLGPIELMKSIVGGMAERGFGRVVNIGTIAAKTPVEARLLSGAMRSALCNYTGAVARRLAQRNVAINNILPGMFQTSSSRNLLQGKASEEAQKFLKELRIPAARFGDPDDVGAFCAMLCSNYAGYVIGQAIVIDGGLLSSVF